MPSDGFLHFLNFYWGSNPRLFEILKHRTSDSNVQLTFAFLKFITDRSPLAKDPTITKF
jgi:hypothetical protein